MKFSMARVLLVLIVGAMLLAACGSNTPAASPTPSGPVGDAAKGQEKFAATCISCHGPDAKGIAGLGKDLTTSEFAKGKADAELVAFVKTASVDMPPKGGNPALTDQDLADIVAYVRTLMLFSSLAELNPVWQGLDIALG